MAQSRRSYLGYFGRFLMAIIGLIIIVVLVILTIRFVRERFASNNKGDSQVVTEEMAMDSDKNESGSSDEKD
jgi:uncharacterized membrane protein